MLRFHITEGKIISKSDDASIDKKISRVVGLVDECAASLSEILNFDGAVHGFAVGEDFTLGFVNETGDYDVELAGILKDGKSSFREIASLLAE